MTALPVLSSLYAPTRGWVTISGHSVTREPMAVRSLIGWKAIQGCVALCKQSD